MPLAEADTRRHLAELRAAQGRLGEALELALAGGAAATLAFFAQKALGYEDVALYDASMQEWGKDETLPMEIG